MLKDDKDGYETTDTLLKNDRLSMFEIVEFVLPDDFEVKQKNYIATYLEKEKKKIEVCKERLMSIEQEAKQLKEAQDKRCHDRIVINPTRACEICGKLAITEKFYAFPCRHTFHVECLKRKW